MLAHALALSMVVTLVAAGYYFATAMESARRTFPVALRQETIARSALPSVIWESSVPQQARSDYLRSQLYGCVALALMTLLALPVSPLFGSLAAILAAIGAASLVHALIRNRPLRRQAKRSPPSIGA